MIHQITCMPQDDEGGGGDGMRITKIRLGSLRRPSDPDDWDSRMMNEITNLLQVEVCHKSRRGQNIRHYVYYHESTRPLPPFFMTNQDNFSLLRSAQRVDLMAERVIRKSWQSQQEARDSEWEAVLHFLSHLCSDHAGIETRHYDVNLIPRFSTAPRLFPWSDIPELSEEHLVHAHSPHRTMDGAILLKIPAHLASRPLPLSDATGICFGFGLKKLSAELLSCGSVREILLPPTVQEIGPQAFAGCQHLERLELPLGCRVAWDAFPPRAEDALPLVIHYICSV